MVQVGRLPSTFPKHWGAGFTPTLHRSLVPSIDPTKVKLPSSFSVLITGAGKGFGASTALSYAQAGASAIIIVARTLADLEAVSKQITEISPSTKVLCVPCDVTKEEQVIDLAKQVKDTFNRLDVLINNAGKGVSFLPDDSVAGGKRFPCDFIEGSSSEFRDCFELNFFGTYLCTRHLLPLIIATEGGAKAIINIVSGGAHLASAFLSPIPYNISKMAIVRMSQYVDDSHRERHGVVCYALHPGTCSARTPLTDGNVVLVDDVELCGGYCVWLTKQKREWLSGRYVSSEWDVDELEAMKDEIVKGDKLKFTMDV
ncbi:NAD(P)-binding protein [Cadophora sp. DSE1049]|nr:NAD(P)-binding protein [Cadophora sp. DSE1049]